MILARMAKARDENKALMRPYTLTRNYKLFAKGNDQAKSEVTAEVTFVPPARRTYKIVRSSGMSLGEKIVRKMLEGETQIVEQSGANDITPENYRFELLVRPIEILSLFGGKISGTLVVPERRIELCGDATRAPTPGPGFAGMTSFPRPESWR